MLATANHATNRQQRRANSRMSAKDDAKLIRRLDAYCDRWMANEGSRRARDRRGMRLFRGETWESPIGGMTQSLQITSPSVLSLFERVAADVLRGTPEPEIEAQNPDEEDAASVAQGALRTNWRNTKFLPKLANAYRLAGFTRAVGCYHYWRSELRGGIGDVDRRFIPGHRLIVDDRHSFVRDMEFIGFEEEMSRAKLITLFPDKVDEIEAAGESQNMKPTGINPDPLMPSGNGSNLGNMVVDRLIAAGSANQPPYTSATSIRNANSRQGDPLDEKVKVRFLWIDDPTPRREKRPRLDPKTKQPLYELARGEDGQPLLEHDGHEVIDTRLGPQYVPQVKPRYEMVMDDVIVRKYSYWRHVAYVAEDKVKLWDVSWDGPVPISILRDRLPAYGFDAPGTALRAMSLNSARQVLYTIIFERLKKSLAGSWFTTSNTGIKRNTLLNEIGLVYTVTSQNINEAIKEFPQSPLDSAYFGLLDKIETEMERLLGVTPMMQGQAAGRADSPATYEQIADQSGGPTLDRAKLVDEFIGDCAEIDLWFMQHYYTHEHTVEFETAEGFATWVEASALVMRGPLAVRVETGSTLGRNTARDRQEANENAQAGFYALPMLGRVGRVRNWRQALKQKAAIMRLGPQMAWLLGPSGAPPSTQATNLRAQQQRSHHRPGGK